MASQVPTGYNPETSLLTGGTAPILPVQGGGGMDAGGVPAAYNPDQSLLNSGHNAPIVPIRGGGSVGPGSSVLGIQGHKPPTEGGAEGEKPYESYSFEQYDPPFKMISIPPLPDNIARRAVITEYTKKSAPDLMEVKRLEREP